MSRQFGAFVIAGGIAALANWLSGIALSFVVGLELAVVLAYLVGMTVAYILNRQMVFARSGRPVADEYVRFCVVNMVALVQVFLVTIGLSRWGLPALGVTFYPDAIAHAIGVASPVLTSYFGHKMFTFSTKPSSKKGN